MQIERLKLIEIDKIVDVYQDLKNNLRLQFCPSSFKDRCYASVSNNKCNLKFVDGFGPKVIKIKPSVYTIKFRLNEKKDPIIIGFFTAFECVEGLFSFDDDILVIDICFYPEFDLRDVNPNSFAMTDLEYTLALIYVDFPRKRRVTDISIYLFDDVKNERILEGMSKSNHIVKNPSDEAAAEIYEYSESDTSENTEQNTARPLARYLFNIKRNFNWLNSICNAI